MMDNKLLDERREYQKIVSDYVLKKKQTLFSCSDKAVHYVLVCFIYYLLIGIISSSFLIFFLIFSYLSLLLLFYYPLLSFIILRLNYLPIHSFLF